MSEEIKWRPASVSFELILIDVFLIAIKVIYSNISTIKIPMYHMNKVVSTRVMHKQLVISKYSNKSEVNGQKSRLVV